MSQPDRAQARLLDATRRAEDEHFWFRGLRAFARPLVAAGTKGLTAPRILDCGCGTGANLKLLGEFGTAVGFDLEPTGPAHAHRYGERLVATASVTAMPFRSASFDVVAAFDLLYAIPEAMEGVALAEIHRVLRPGGTAIFTVAALPMLGGNDAAFRGELRRSTRRRLRTVLERAHFDVTRLTYTNASIFPLVFAVRMLQRLGGAAPGSGSRDFVVPSKPVNAALTALLGLEARALRYVDMPIGSSLLCVARTRG